MQRFYGFSHEPLGKLVHCTVLTTPPNTVEGQNKEVG